METTPEMPHKQVGERRNGQKPTQSARERRWARSKKSAVEVDEGVEEAKILKDAPKEVSGVLDDTPSIASYLHRPVPPTDDLSVPLGDLTPFGSLRSLILIVPVALEFQGATVRPDVFPVLESLCLHDCHTSILRLFSLFECVPALCQ